MSDKQKAAEKACGELISTMREYFQSTGLHMDVFGELGELYAEAFLNMERYETNSPICDGLVNGRKAEIKTISPVKYQKFVRAKRCSEWELVIAFQFDDKLEKPEIRFRNRDEIMNPNSKTGFTTMSFSAMTPFASLI